MRTGQLDCRSASLYTRSKAVYILPFLVSLNFLASTRSGLADTTDLMTTIGGHIYIGIHRSFALPNESAYLFVTQISSVS